MCTSSTTPPSTTIVYRSRWRCVGVGGEARRTVATLTMPMPTLWLYTHYAHAYHTTPLGDVLSGVDPHPVSLLLVPSVGRTSLMRFRPVVDHGWTSRGAVPTCLLWPTYHLLTTTLLPNIHYLPPTTCGWRGRSAGWRCGRSGRPRC